jgi:hypothetical protein
LRFYRGTGNNSARYESRYFSRDGEVKFPASQTGREKRQALVTRQTLISVAIRTIGSRSYVNEYESRWPNIGCLGYLGIIGDFSDTAIPVRTNNPSTLSYAASVSKVLLGRETRRYRIVSRTRWNNIRCSHRVPFIILGRISIATSILATNI